MAISKQLVLIGTGATSLSVGGFTAYYLTKDKTIKDRLISLGNTIINEDKEYQIVIKELKGEKEFEPKIAPLSAIFSDVESVNKANELKNWCNAILNDDLSVENSEKLIEKAKKYCTKPPLTIKEKFERGNKRLISNWEGHLDKLSKEVDKEGQLQKDLTQENAQVTSFTTPSAKVASEALKGWCEKNIQTELISDDAKDIWAKVEKRCLE